MRILTVLLTGILGTAWVNARLPWSPFALYFTTLIFMGAYLCLTAGPMERKARRRMFRREWSLEELNDIPEEENATPWSIGLLCFLLGSMGDHANDETSAGNLGLL